jgi:CDP-diacylglycerol---glycerol-3-phosphate 3-phosphatidyltransferase
MSLASAIDLAASLQVLDQFLLLIIGDAVASPDLLASLGLGVFCVLVLTAHRAAGAPGGHHRVKQQGATFFLGRNLMDAGYWMLQPVVRRLVRLGITPATISWWSLLPALAAALTAATGHWGMTAWCLLASALLDVLDGAVARAIGQTSAAGAMLDSVLDRYAEFFFFAGVFVYYRQELVPQLITLTALLGSFLITYSTAKAEAIGVTPPRGSMKRSDRLTLLILGAALAPLSQHWLEKPSGPFAWPVLSALGVIAVMANLSAIRRFAVLAERARALGLAAAGRAIALGSETRASGDVLASALIRPAREKRSGSRPAATSSDPAAIASVPPRKSAQ